jgi:hypothetical protein
MLWLAATIDTCPAFRIVSLHMHHVPQTWLNRLVMLGCSKTLGGHHWWSPVHGRARGLKLVLSLVKIRVFSVLSEGFISLLSKEV